MYRRRPHRTARRATLSFGHQAGKVSDWAHATFRSDSASSGGEPHQIPPQPKTAQSATQLAARGRRRRAHTSRTPPASRSSSSGLLTFRTDDTPAVHHRRLASDRYQPDSCRLPARPLPDLRDRTRPRRLLLQQKLHLRAGRRLWLSHLRASRAVDLPAERNARTERDARATSER